MTKTQRAVLERLAAGDPILLLTGGKLRAFFLHGSETVRMGTIQALKRQRLVRQTPMNVNAVIELTEAGQKVLAAVPRRKKRARALPGSESPTLGRPS